MRLAWGGRKVQVKQNIGNTRDRLYWSLLAVNAINGRLEFLQSGDAQTRSSLRTRDESRNLQVMMCLPKRDVQLLASYAESPQRPAKTRCAGRDLDDDIRPAPGPVCWANRYSSGFANFLASSSSSAWRSPTADPRRSKRAPCSMALGRVSLRNLMLA